MTWLLRTDQSTTTGHTARSMAKQAVAFREWRTLAAEQCVGSPTLRSDRAEGATRAAVLLAARVALELNIRSRRIPTCRRIGRKPLISVVLAPGCPFRFRESEHGALTTEMVKVFGRRPSPFGRLGTGPAYANRPSTNPRGCGDGLWGFQILLGFGDGETGCAREPARAW
jgi:hypothetical protein